VSVRDGKNLQFHRHKFLVLKLIRLCNLRDGPCGPLPLQPLRPDYLKLSRMVSGPRRIGRRGRPLRAVVGGEEPELCRLSSGYRRSPGSVRRLSCGPHAFVNVTRPPTAVRYQFRAEGLRVGAFFAAGGLSGWRGRKPKDLLYLNTSERRGTVSDPSASDPRRRRRLASELI